MASAALIVETEAYEPDDPASHSFGGTKARNATMFGPPGRLYVYRLVRHPLVRERRLQPRTASALRCSCARSSPRIGLDAMRARRGLDDVRLLAAGPGRLTQALGISGAHDGLDVLAPPFVLTPPEKRVEVVASRRVGITRATDRLWRYCLAGSSFVSRPRPRV